MPNPLSRLSGMDPVPLRESTPQLRHPSLPPGRPVGHRLAPPSSPPKQIQRAKGGDNPAPLPNAKLRCPCPFKKVLTDVYSDQRATRILWGSP